MMHQTPERTHSEHMIHRSLHRPITYAGAAPELVIVEVATIFALVFLVGLHVATILLAIGYATIIHSLSVWITARDPQMIAVYLRSLTGQDFYPPHAVPWARSIRPRLAIPTRS